MATADKPTTASTSPGRPSRVVTLLIRDPFPGGEAGTRWKFDAVAYYKMAEVGILMEDDRVELIDGDIVMMSPIGPIHASLTTRTTRLLFRVFGERALVSAGNPVRLDAYSEPQPDIQVVRLRDDFYGTAHPTPDDVFFLLEVVDSSASRDRGVKLDLYARAGVPEVWLVDPNRSTVEACRRPVGGLYTERNEFSRGQTITSAAFPDVALRVDDVLG